VTGIVLTDDNNGDFTIAYHPGGYYTVSLSTEKSKTKGDYTYTARATAEGSAT
jgi:ferredoxin-NADP reductase